MHANVFLIGWISMGVFCVEQFQPKEYVLFASLSFSLSQQCDSAIILAFMALYNLYLWMIQAFDLTIIHLNK